MSLNRDIALGKARNANGRKMYLAYTLMCRVFNIAGNSTADAKVEANNTINKYKTKAMQFHKWSEVEWSLLPPSFTYSWGEGPIFYEDYMQGVNFIKNADERWLDIIGARYVNYYYKTGYNCIDVNNIPLKVFQF